MRASKMAQLIKVFAVKCDDLSSIPVAYMVEELSKLSSGFYTCAPPTQ